MNKIINIFMTLTALAFLIYLNSKALDEKRWTQFSKLFLKANLRVFQK